MAAILFHLPFDYLYQQITVLTEHYYYPVMFHIPIFLFICMGSIYAPLFGQDLDPRAYIRVPVRMTTLVSGLVYSYGGVVSDPTLPLKNIKADVYSASLGVVHSFSLFGLTAQGLVALPYSRADATGELGNQQQSISRMGFADMRMRLSVLFLGAPAVTLPQMMKDRTRKTILGASINMIAPTGQFFSDKLINLGTNRWAFRPELALSQPIGKRWMFDLYTGVWLFTNNASFYPGTVLRKQDPMGAFQAHFSYNLNTFAWVAVNATFYTGGASTLEGIANDDWQSNTRIGITAVVPTGKMSSLKFAASTGAIVRIGQDFTTFSLGWQQSWIKGMRKK